MVGEFSALLIFRPISLVVPIISAVVRIVTVVAEAIVVAVVLVLGPVSVEVQVLPIRRTSSDAVPTLLTIKMVNKNEKTS